MKTKEVLRYPPMTDLRAVTRASNVCLTTVKFKRDAHEAAIDWLIAGQVELFHNNDRRDGRYRLEARVADDVTDPSHDSLIVFRLPLVGMQFDAIPVYYHAVQIVAWVDPDAEEDFHVPGPGYNPSKLKGAERCKDKSCVMSGHIIVPEGHYVPKFDADLYQLARGKRVEISIGPVYKDE